MLFNQRVMTPNGPAIFIGYVDDGMNVQVSRLVPASSMTKDECTRRKRNVVQMSQIDFLNWQKTARFCINETYALEEVSTNIPPKKTTTDPDPVIQGSDVEPA